MELWASYCRPCIDKLPELVERHENGERIIALSVDVPSERSRAEGLLQGAKVAFPNYFLVLDDDANENGFDTMVDLMRLPIPTELILYPGGILGGVRTGSSDSLTHPVGTPADESGGH